MTPNRPGQGSIRRRVLLAVMAPVALVVAYGAVLAYPEPLFRQSRSHAGFTVYAHRAVPPSIDPALDEAQRRLARSALYRRGDRFRLFVAGSPKWYSFLNGPYRGAMGRAYEFGGAIFLPGVDAASAEVVHFDGRRASLPWIVAHEATHDLMRRRLGLLASWRLPRWKSEGYPEYIGSNGPTDLAERVRLLDQRPGAGIIVLPDGYRVPRGYFLAETLWRYLLDVRRLTFDGVIGLQATPEAIEGELRERLAARRSG